MQIEIDFDVFKALTALRENEADTYNHVLRRLLNLPASDPTGPGLAPILAAMSGHSTQGKGSGAPTTLESLLTAASKGVWYNNVFFPEGTHFRATYKGKTFFAQIKDGRWIGQDGVLRSSPSDAANAISGTNVNGWRFWYARRPNDSEWRRMDEFK